MALSRAFLYSMQESSPPMTDEERLAFLRGMRADEMQAARTWMNPNWKIKKNGFHPPNGDFVLSHLANARAIHKEIKALKLQMVYASIDSLVGDEPIRSTDYDDIAENLNKENS